MNNPTDSSTDYEALLMGLAKNANPEEEVLKAIQQKSSDKTQWKNPLLPEKSPETKTNQEEEILSVETIFRMAQIVQGTLQNEISERSKKLTEPTLTSENPQENRWALQTKTSASHLLCTLAHKSQESSKIENWEATSRSMALSDLKQKTITRAALTCESIFDHAKSSPQTEEKMANAIKIFREASRTFELSLAAKNNIQAGPGKATTKTRNIPPKAVEILACLTQIAIECIKDNTPKLKPEEEKALRDFQSQGRRAFAIAQAAGDAGASTQEKSQKIFEELLSENLGEKCDSIPKTQKLWADWKTPEGETLSKKSGEIIRALYLEAKVSPETTEKIDAILEKIQSETFSVEEPFEKEWITIRELEKTHQTLEKELKAHLENPSKKQDLPLTLRAFAALQKETQGLGKASQMVLLGKIIGSKTNQVLFEKAERENPENTLEGFGFINETQIIQQKSGRTLATAGFDPKETNQLEELCELTTNLDYAESILFSSAVLRTLNNSQRYKVEEAARKVILEEDQPQGLEKSLRKIYDNVQKTLDTLEDTLKSQKTHLEALPKMLRDHEASETLDSAVTRLIQTAQQNQEELEQIANDPEAKTSVKNAAKTLAEIARKTLGEDGIEPNSLLDISKKIQTETSGTDPSLGRIIANLSENRGLDGKTAEIDEVAKRLLLKTKIEATNPQETPISKEDAENILKIESKKSGREKETPFSKIKTPELSHIVNLTNDPMAIKALRMRYQSRFLRDIRIIRRWREKTKGMGREERKSLAISLCSIPESIRRSCHYQILRNLESCTQPPIWNDHASISKNKVEDAYKELAQSYSILKTSFRREKSPSKNEQELMGLLQKIQGLTEEIHHKSPSRMVRAELLAESLKSQSQEMRACQLQALEKLSQLTPASELIEPSIDFLQSWGNYTGNRESLLKNSILLPKEKGRTEKTQSANYLASTLEIHTKNLTILKDYTKAILHSPESLAETYLQGERSKRERAAGQEPQHVWLEKVQKQIQEAIEQASILENEVDSMNHIFDARIEEASKSEDEFAKEEFLSPKFQRAFDIMISQKEKQIQDNYLKADRLEKLVQEVTKTQDEPSLGKKAPEPQPEVESSLAQALDTALRASQQKLPLPKVVEKEQEIGAGEILNASLIQEKIQLARKVIEETGKKLRETNPRAQEILEAIDPESDPLETCKKLRECIFESIKNCEMYTAQTQKKQWELNPEITRLKNKLLSENPDLEAQQRKWRNNLNDTLRHLNGACAQLQEKTQEITKSPEKEGSQEPSQKTIDDPSQKEKQLVTME